MTKTAVIVAHGQPSDPDRAEVELTQLAVKVQAVMPDWRVASATLAQTGALAARLAELGPSGFVYPLFMAGGWFTQVNLPQRLAKAGGEGWAVLPPFGEDPGVQDLTVTLAAEAAARAGLPAAKAQLLLAAHGSFRSPAPSQVANAMAERIARELGFAQVKAGFIDQTPRIAEIAAELAPDMLVLPFFAAKGGHVLDDLPAALAEAGYVLPVPDPVGLDPRVPALIAAALRRALG